METFWQSFLEDVEVFKQKTKELSRNDLLKLTEEPGGTSSIDNANHESNSNAISFLPFFINVVGDRRPMDVKNSIRV